MSGSSTTIPGKLPPFMQIPWTNPQTGVLMPWAATFLNNLLVSLGATGGVTTQTLLANLQIIQQSTQESTFVTTFASQAAIPDLLPAHASDQRQLLPLEHGSPNPLPPAFAAPQDVVILHNGARLMDGTGSPAGVVVGSPGDVWINRSGGAGTTLYVKESGVNDTAGWVGK